jgi:hypothetical protein
MEDNRIAVENLKKVKITVQAGSSPESMDISPEPVYFEFIFGLGTSGLTPFEFSLANKHRDDEVILHINLRDIPETFAHIDLPLFQDLPEMDSLYLKIRIVDIQPAAGRELIKAMAEMGGCGDGCCGNH